MSAPPDVHHQTYNKQHDFYDHPYEEQALFQLLARVSARVDQMNFLLKEFRALDVLEGVSQSFEVSSFPQLGKILHEREWHNR